MRAMAAPSNEYVPQDAGALALARLQERRARPERARPVADDFKALQANLARDARRFGAIGAVWAEHCPPELVARTRVAAFERGVLHIEAADASTRYALDRALRAGLAGRIVESSRSAVRRVRVALSR